MFNIDLTSISPVTDAEAVRLAAPAAFASLARQITAIPVSPASLPAGADPLPVVGPAAGRGSRELRLRPRHRAARHLTRRRTLLVGLPAAALAAAVALVVGSQVSGGGGNGANSTAAVQALSFIKENGYIKVIVRDPLADTAWYNADFARHHLNIALHLVPVSPSLVGTVVEMSTSPSAVGNEIKIITAEGRCFTGGGGAKCPVGLKIPTDFHGQADVTFGRAAKPGEQYESAASIFTPGEALAGLRPQVIGQRVSKVWALLARHHIKVAVCRDASNSNVNPAEVPGDYYVTGVIPWAPGEVIAWTGPTPPSGM